MKKSIVLKLWLLIVLLISMTMCAVGFSLDTLLGNLYFDIQAKNMILEGKNIEEVMRNAADKEEMSQQIGTISRFIQGHIMVLDKDGIVGSCNPGMPLSPGVHLSGEEVDEVLKGNIVIKKGSNFGFQNSMLMVALPIVENEEVLGAIMLFKPVEPITKTVDNFRRLIFLTAIGAIILASIISYFVSIKMIRPLTKMNEVAQRVAAGDFRGRVPVETADEIGSLAKTFNYMSGQLENAEQLRRQFLSDVAHELRTPLSLLQGYSEALADGMAASEKERKEYLQIISDEVTRLNRIVEDLADLNAMEAGQLTLYKSEFNINDILTGIMRTFKPAAEEKNITLEVELLQGKVPAINGDQGRIEQILINLVNNALNHTHSGGKISLKAAYDYEKENFKIEVSDSGEGIAPEEIPQIWQRFYRIDKARTRKKGGSGLGLAIVKNLVEAHGGSIDVLSSVGKGTTFIIVFPKE